MDNIDFSTMKTMTALRLGNMQSSDPFYAYLGRWVNQAGNNVLTRALSRNQRRRMNLFPELYDYWDDLTTDGVDYISKPEDVLFVDALYCMRKTGTIDLADDTRYSMTEISDDYRWQFLSRSSSPTGYPTKWYKRGNRLQIHPTPSSSYTTKILIAGFARENTLSGDSDVFVMDAMWHPAVVDMAVYIGATWMEWAETAQAALMACDRNLEETITVLGRENASDHNPRGRVSMDPTN